MALDPGLIAEELEKIPRFDATGKIISTKLVEKNSKCLHTYESTLDTGSEQVVFSYNVLAGRCITDGIFEVEAKPFSKNTEATLNLTQSKPHQLVSSDVHYVPFFTPTLVIYAISAVILLTLVRVVLIAISKKRQTKENIRR